MVFNRSCGTLMSDTELKRHCAERLNIPLDQLVQALIRAGAKLYRKVAPLKQDWQELGNRSTYC